MLKRLRLKFVLVNMILVTIMLCVIFSLTVQHTGADLKRESEGGLSLGDLPLGQVREVSPEGL